MSSQEPKDVSDRTLSAFEGYLSYVNSMYFDYNFTPPAQTLNQLSSQLSSAQKKTQAGPDARGISNTSRATDEADELAPNHFHYLTLDVLSNPLRVPHVFENWSPREIAIFEC